jgi:hypothetical protein
MHQNSSIKMTHTHTQKKKKKKEEEEERNPKIEGSRIKL